MKNTAGDVEAVFEHWKEVMDSPRSHLDIKRRDSIKARLLDGYSLSDLCDAINGCSVSRFHMGENDRRRRYNDITLIFRDAQHTDDFIGQWDAIRKRAESIEAERVADGAPVTRTEGRERIKAMLKMVGR